MNIYTWQNEIFGRLLSNRLPHALLLKGRAGIGKLDFAVEFSRALLCTSPDAAGGACGTCPSCNWLASGSHPDFRRVEPAEESKGQITVEQVRSLYGFVGMTSGGYRIVLLHPADAMNASAANALLKTLEEPPGNTLFILVSSRPNHLLPTILSRCRIIAMPRPDPEQAEKWLKSQGLDDPCSRLAEAGNAPLLALGLSREDASIRESFLREISHPSTLDPFALAELHQKSSLSGTLSWLQKWCFDIELYSLTGNVRYFPSLSDKIREIAGKTDRIGLAQYLGSLAQSQRISNHPVNSRLFLEEVLLNYKLLTARR
ncbi:MAG: DNA polymerase III subunit delta' [Burkholderiales bacterium]|nr:DNA polymerase III subunit delta' [Burkholderiales bacterium]